MENKVEVLTLRITPRLAGQIREAAKADDRKIAEWLREILRREVQQTAAESM